MATVEAVIVIPVLILIAVSVLYAHRLGSQKLEALVTARSCAWHYAVNGCQDVKPGCAGLVAVRRSDGGDGIAERVEKETGPLAEQLNHSDTLLERLTDVPVLGGALGAIFGESAEARVSREIARPKLYGGGTAVRYGEYFLACNEKPKTAGEVAVEVFRKLVGKFL